VAVKPVDARLLEDIDRYIEALSAPNDPALAACLTTAEAAGLPAINVSAVEGKLLYVVARLAGARRVLEIGTLAGYSTIWLARAVPADGAVVTLEINPIHAQVARQNLRRAVTHVTVDVRVGAAAATLRNMIACGQAPFDLIFIDADKPCYAEYLDLGLRLARPGTVVLADNVIRHGAVLDRAAADANAEGVRAYNAAVAAHPRLESVIVPMFREIVDGLSIARVREPAATAPRGNTCIDN
jgi:predicted O-methyltransferase YrrM